MKYQNESPERSQRAGRNSEREAYERRRRQTDLGEYPAREGKRPDRASAKKAKRSSPVKPVLWILLAVIFVTAFGTYQYVFSGYKPTNTVDRKNLGIDPANKNGSILQIAVFGVDSYEDKKGRSDCTMILNVDRKNRQIKVVSVLRDSYLPIEGHGKDKLTHAFAYGGAELMLRTLNENFHLALSDYIVLDYEDVARMVDAVDGLDLEITEKERKEINRICEEMVPGAETVEETGTVHLNGLQATAYARIRKIDSETMRTRRQRIVIQALIDKSVAAGPLRYPALMRQALSSMESNVSRARLFRVFFAALFSDKQIKEYVVPSDDDHPIGGSYAGFWCWRYDIDAAAGRLKDFLDQKITDEVE